MPDKPPPQLHLKKLSVGSTDLKSLAAWHEHRLKEQGRIMHVTRNHPRREAEILPFGCMFWIIKGQMLARQRIGEFLQLRREDGSRACGIVLLPGLIPVRPRPHRPFQGWRYLEAKDAPPDIGAMDDDTADMPSEMAEELREYGLL